MHKKYTKLKHTEHHHNSRIRRDHLKSKEIDDSTLEVIKAPQNSRNELNKKLEFEDHEVKEKFKSNKEKYKHKRQESKSNDRNSKTKHDKIVQDLEPVKQKEKKEKRDKERLNKIEKYLEGLNKDSSKKPLRNRPLSLDSSKAFLKSPEKYIRREKTFHDKASRVSTNSRLSVLNHQQPPPITKEKSHQHKKHKHKECKNRDSSKEKNTRDNQQSVVYCEVELQSPFLQGRKYLYPKASKEKSSRKRPSSIDNSAFSQLEPSQRDKIKHLKDKEPVSVKLSTRRSKLKIDLRDHKDQKSNVTLGPYREYFAFDKPAQHEKETTRQKKKKRQKGDSTMKLSRNQKIDKSREENIIPEKAKKDHKMTSPNNLYKEKIEDDIKGYFFKIQNLIDKKLDFFLGNSSNPKQSKSHLLENENDAGKTRSNKEKKSESHDQYRSKKRRKKIERCEGVKEEKQEKRLVEEAKVRHSVEENKKNRKSRPLKNSEVSNISLKRERYPSEDSKSCRWHQTSHQQRYQDYRSVSPPRAKRGGDKKVKEHKRHINSYARCSTHEMSPHRLINMLEHPSTFSVQSNTSLLQRKVDGVNHRQNDIQTGPKEIENYQKRDRSLSKRNTVPHEDDLNIEDKTLAPEVYSKKPRKRVPEPNTNLVKEKLVNVSKYGPSKTLSEFNRNEHYYKRSRSSDRNRAIPGEDDFDEMGLLEVHNKKNKKDKRQFMNLECKTISIVGIPSQIRDSTIFNETQTTTSLNVINLTEDVIEQKKKSKRFKLYYKYSVADNKCPNESDKSSEDKKSVVSDSYKVVSDPSDHSIEVWEDKDETSKEVNNSDLAKVLFIMKKEKVHKNRSEKYRKRGNSPQSVTLNNIVEEPSNISIAIRAKENTPFLKKDLDCTYFKTLKSSSSGCNLEVIKRSTQNHANKHKNRNPLKDNGNIPKSYPKKNSEGGRLREGKKSKYEEERVYNKKMATSKNKKKHRDMNNYTSKSDIDISYDSLRKYKFCKDKQKFDGPSHFREQLRQILPDILFRKSSPERKSIDTIIKEEIREIMREIPKRVIREISFGEEPDVEIKDLHKRNLKEPNGTCKNQDEKEKIYYSEKTRDSHETDTNEKLKTQDVEESAHPSKEITDLHERDLKESNDNLEMQSIEEETYNSKPLCESPKTQEVEDKTYCSKKIGTYHATSKIPSLIKGYTGITASQITRDDSTKIDNSPDQFTQNETSENVSGELDENNLVDAATGISIAEELAEKTMIMLENKKSQTPSYLDTPTVVTICDAPKQYKHSKKVATMNNIKYCQIVDPFANTKIGSVCKSTRPIMNVENSQFPTHKLPEPVTPVPGQYKRQKSTLSEEKCVKFENQGEFGPRKFLERRPATAGDQHNRSSPMDTFTRKATKPALTISTNIVTIDTSAEKYKTYDTQSKWSRRDIKENTDQQETMMNRYDVTTHHMQRNLISKSSISLNDGDVESKIGSLVCVDKYSNIQKINLNSNSNSRSLDRYTTKSLLSDNPHTSRLFLTKSFDPKMNTYQRRKMYDETIRRKMKKKYGSPGQMGPRIFEVRYLTLENPNLDEGFDAKNSPTPVVNQKCISRLPTYNTKTNKAKPRSKTYKPSIKKSRKTFPKNKEDACKFSGRDIFAPVISDVDQLNKFRRKTFPEKKVEEIFVKDSFSKQEKGIYKEQSASVTLKNEDISEEHVTNKTESADTSENFKNLIDHLYNSIITYCDTRFKLPQSPPPNSTEIVKDEQNVPKSPHVNEKSYIVFPKPSNESVSTTNDPYKESSCSERNFISEEKEWKRPANLICTHLSCPVLAGSTSSFDYLYEDGPIELNKDAVLLHFKKPMKTILGYALNNTNRIQRETFRNFHKEEYRTSNSVTESEESGYSSTNSKKCASVSSFFRKPSIVNLFKPVKKLEISLQSTSSLDIPKSGPNLQEYNVMNQKCIEYAEKVRNQSQNKNKSEETFQEIPLDVLLLCKKSSAYFSDFNSNCSLCKKHSNSDLPDITEADELSNSTDNLDLIEDGNIIEDNNATDQDKNTETLLEDNIHEETSFLYKDMDCKPCVDIITLQKSQTSFTINDTSQLIKEIMQCPVVLSLTNLNSCSLTVIEEPNDNNTDFCFEGMKKESVKSISLDVANLDHMHSKENCHSSSCASKSPSYVDIDGKSDISSGWGCRYSNSSSVASRFMAKRFFDSLLKVYEKEIEVTNKLFQDNDFFLNVLLESVKSGELPKSKNFKLKKLFKDKVKNYIGNMFHPKNCTAKSSVCVDVLGTYNSNNNHQRKLQILAGDARKYFSMFVQAVKTNKDINDEIKTCGLLKLLERIEDGDFSILRKKEEVDFEQEIREQVKEAFVNIHQLSAKEARKHKRSLTTDDMKLIRTFVSKYRIGLLSKTDLIATYIGRGVLKTEGHLKAAVNYLIQQNKTNDIDLKDFDEHCKSVSV